MDVAQHAQVSMKTVSRVLNDEPNVVPAMRERVMASVKALDYRPNLHARSLARARSSLLGLLYYASSSAFVMGLQQGATARCRALGYHLVVEQLDDSGRHVPDQLRHMLTALRPDGLILAPPVCDDPDILRLLGDAGVPCVLISPGAARPGFGNVAIDDVQAASAITGLLIAQGHRRIGHIHGNPRQAAAPRRLEGYRQALRAHGLADDPSLVVPGDFVFASGMAGCHALLALPQPPTAIFAANDEMALGALAAAQQHGLQVPRDLSVVGFDDAPQAALVWPPLTTVRQPVAEMAEAAVDMLVSRPDTAAPRGDGEAGEPVAAMADRVLPFELVLRASSQAPASAG
jgi:LacI family transcriptional regulator